ncbi:MAG: potassium channel family protein [Gordonia sp. (in: high G+C Gram-positive bacteria)]|uniref:potassium channel family protein n=1 Tax=Gordonia sp. (in: high G+C Gram-positive bacteria) TaxID=84139 RepID=UPI0039E2C4A9
MTEPDPATEPESSDDLEDALASGRGIVQAILRPLFAAGVLLLGYFMLPIRKYDELHVLGFIIGVALLVTFCVWEFRRFMGSRYPVPSALEVLTAFAGLYVVAFSTLYFLLSDYSPGSFNEKFTRVDALYFCMTVMTTTGFGDLSPESQAARVAVSVQMMTTLVIVGLGVRFVGILLHARVTADRAKLVQAVTEAGESSGE